MGDPTTRADRRAATARRILEAARAEFGEYGLEAATVRGIAQRAGVDPSLVIQHYGSKAELFAVAIDIGTGAGGADTAEHLFDVLMVRLDEPPPQTRALVRSMLTAPEATEVMRRFLDERSRTLARGDNDPDADLRAALTVTSILGLIVARHFLHLDGLAHITEEQARTVVHPWLLAALRAQTSDDDE